MSISEQEPDGKHVPEPTMTPVPAKSAPSSPVKRSSSRSSTGTREGCLGKLSNRLDRRLTELFAAIGRHVAEHPKRTVGICIAFTFLSLIGLIRFRVETNGEKLCVALWPSLQRRAGGRVSRSPA